MATWFGTAQALRMLSNVEGLTMVMFLFFEIYVVLNLVLAIKAHRQVHSRKSLQSLLMYVAWSILMSSHLIIYYLKGRWTVLDSKMCALVSLALVATVFIGMWWKGRGITDPIIQGVLALICKTVPQLYLAYCIYDAGSGKGLSSVTVWVGHTTVFIRAGMLVYTHRESGGNKNTAGSLISEIGNSLSRWTVTAVWLAH